MDFARAQSVSLPPVTVTAPEQRKQTRRTEQSRDKIVVADLCRPPCAENPGCGSSTTIDPGSLPRSIWRSARPRRCFECCDGATGSGHGHGSTCDQPIGRGHLWRSVPVAARVQHLELRPGRDRLRHFASRLHRERARARHRLLHRWRTAQRSVVAVHAELCRSQYPAARNGQEHRGRARSVLASNMATPIWAARSTSPRSNREPFASVGVSGGTQGTARGVATYSTTQGTWLPYLALEGYHTDGYRDNSFVDRYNSFNKITTDAARRRDRLVPCAGLRYGIRRARLCQSRCGRSRLISERAATNRTDGGNKQLENFVTNYASGAKDQELKGTLFVSHDNFNRYADFGGGQRSSTTTVSWSAAASARSGPARSATTCRCRCWSAATGAPTSSRRSRRRPRRAPSAGAAGGRSRADRDTISPPSARSRSSRCRG